MLCLVTRGDKVQGFDAPAGTDSKPDCRDVTGQIAGLFVVESQTLGKCSPGLWEGCLSAYLANSLKGPYDAKNRPLAG